MNAVSLFSENSSNALNITSCPDIGHGARMNKVSVTYKKNNATDTLPGTAPATC